MKKLLVTKFFGNIVAVLAVAVLFGAGTAYAGVGVGVAPDFPVSVTVGQNGVAVGLEITNNSTPDVGTITLTNIRLIPSCGDSDADSTTCAGAEVDPGIFSVSAAGTGAVACAANTFTIAVNDAITGQVLFTPNATINLAQGATCRINFTVNVVQAPADDSSPTAGLQTLQIGRVSANQTSDGLSGTGLGTDETTVAAQGHIIVNKITDPSGDPQSFNFDATGTGYNDFALTDVAAPNDQTLNAGAYSVSETLPSGWTQTSATCVSSIQDSETIGALELDAGETITCTFTNTKKGHIIVDKITNPAADSQSFSFTAGGAGYSNFSLTDAAAPNNQEVLPGAYTVSEGAVAGWSSNGGVCDNGETPASLDVGAGETVTCTFTNTKGSTIIVDKVTVPSGNSQSFAFTTTGSGYSGFSLTDAAAPNSQSVAAGSYTVAETAVAGWDSDGGVCDNGETPASLDVGAGETVTCTFTNTLQDGHIIIIKQTNPDGDTQSFEFDTDYGDNFNLTDGQQNNSGGLDPGTYSAAEVNLPANWAQSSATCSDQSPVTAISLQAGETVTCTFTNTFVRVVTWCSPGYWKNHLDSWTLDTGTLYDGTVTVSKKGQKEGAPTSPTLLDVISHPQWYGGEATNLVADLLSMDNPDLDFQEGDTRVENCPLN